MSILRSLWILIVCQAIFISGLALSFPFFALYLNRERGMPMLWVGGLLSLSLLAAALSQGLGGELSDVLGRRRVMIASMWARAFLVCLLAESVRRGWSVPVIYSAHLAATFVGNFFMPAAYGWVADHCGARERLKAYGLLRMGGNVGWAVGPALGGLAAERSYPAMFFATAGALAVCALILSAWVRDKAGARRAADGALRGLLRAAEDRRFLWACGIMLLISVVMAQLIVPLSVHAVRYVALSEAQVGLLFSVNGLVVVATQVPVVWILNRCRISTALTLGSVLYALGYGAVGFAPGFAALAGAVAVITLGEVAVSPGLQALAANMAPETLKGRYLGFMALMQQVGNAFGPLLGGLCLQLLSPRRPWGPWLIVAAMALLAAGGFLSLRRWLSREEEGLEDAASAAAVPMEVAV